MTSPAHEGDMPEHAVQVPLLELLREVPRNARLVIDWPPEQGIGTSFIPVGRYCHEAADALSHSRALAADQPWEAVAAVPKDCGEYGHGEGVCGNASCSAAPRHEANNAEDAARWQFFDKHAQSMLDGVRFGEWLLFDGVMKHGSRNAAIDFYIAAPSRAEPIGCTTQAAVRAMTDEPLPPLYRVHRDRSYDQRAKAIIAFNTCKGDLDDKLEAAWFACLGIAPPVGERIDPKEAP